MKTGSVRCRWSLILGVALVTGSVLVAGCGNQNDLSSAPDLKAAPANVPANAPPGTQQSVQGSQQYGAQANEQAAAAAAARRAAQEKSGGQ